MKRMFIALCLISSCALYSDNNEKPAIEKQNEERKEKKEIIITGKDYMKAGIIASTGSIPFLWYSKNMRPGLLKQMVFEVSITTFLSGFMCMAIGFYHDKHSIQKVYTQDKYGFLIEEKAS